MAVKAITCAHQSITIGINKRDLYCIPPFFFFKGDFDSFQELLVT